MLIKIQPPIKAEVLCSLHDALSTRVFTTGGWQQQMTFQRHVENLQRFYRMLRNNGFHKEHIKTFFASSGQLPGTITQVISENLIICFSKSWRDLGQILRPLSDLLFSYASHITRNKWFLLSLRPKNPQTPPDIALCRLSIVSPQATWRECTRQRRKRRSVTTCPTCAGSSTAPTRWSST